MPMRRQWGLRNRRRVGSGRQVGWLPIETKFSVGKDPTIVRAVMVSYLKSTFHFNPGSNCFAKTLVKRKGIAKHYIKGGELPRGRGKRRSWGASTLSLDRERRAFLEPSPPTHAAGFYKLRGAPYLCLHFFRLRIVSSTVSVAFCGP